MPVTVVRVRHREQKCAENYNIEYTKLIFLNCSQHFGKFKPITVSECCLIKLLPCILLEKIHFSI